LILKSNNHKSRNELQIFLEERNIQTRPIFSGNITKQPMMKNYNFIMSENGYKNTDFIMKNGMLIRCHPKLSFSDLGYICELIESFFNQ
jgi:CDP-6-deoxy-D-xylo-4-hexulose-3-dehydrase